MEKLGQCGYFYNGVSQQNKRIQGVHRQFKYFQYYFYT